MPKIWYSGCPNNAPHVYSGRKTVDKVTTQQNVASQVERHVASKVEQDAGSAVDFGDHRELEQSELIVIDGSHLKVEQTVDLTTEQTVDLTTEQDVDTTTEPTREDTKTITLEPNVDEGVTNIQVEKQCVPALSTKDPVDTEVIWLPGSPKKSLQMLDMDKNAASINEKRVTTVQAREREKSKVLVTKTIIPSQNTKYKTSSNSVEANSKKGKRFTISRMNFCKQWLRHCKLSGFEQDRKLMEYVSAKIDLNAIRETRNQVKNVISEMSGYLANLYAKKKWNPNILIKNEGIRRHWSTGWLDGPPIRFTPGVPEQKDITVVVTLNQPGKLPIEKHQANTKKEVICMSLVTNADVFKFLRMSTPPFKAEVFYTLLKALYNNLIQANQRKAEEFCNRYVADIKFKWMTADYKEDVFESKFAFWLGLNIKWPAFLRSNLTSKNPNAKKSMNIKDLERDIAKKCCEYSQEDVSDIIHRMFHHPEDAVRIRSFVESSACSCNVKPVEKIETDKSTEQDPLMLESEIYRTTDASEGVRLTDNNTLERVYKAPSGPRLDALKQALDKLKDKTIDRNIMADQINKESERRDSVKLIVSKLKSGNNKIVTTPVPAKESNSTVNPPVITKASNSTVNPPVITKASNSTVNPPVITKESYSIVNTPVLQKETGEKLVLGPVLDKLIYIKSVLKSGTKVALPTGKIATVTKVSNIIGATVLVPASNIPRGAIQSNRSIKVGATLLPKPHTLNNQTKIPEASNNSQATTPVALTSAKRRIGILRRLPYKPLGVTPRLIIEGPLPNAASCLKLVKTVAPNIITKVSSEQNSSTTKNNFRVYSSIDRSVKALMNDINNGNIKNDDNDKTNLLQSSKLTTETQEGNTISEPPAKKRLTERTESN